MIQKQSSRGGTDVTCGTGIGTGVKKESLAQVFSCEFCEIFNNTFFYRTPLVAVSDDQKEHILIFLFIYWLSLKILTCWSSRYFVTSYHILWRKSIAADTEYCETDVLKWYKLNYNILKDVQGSRNEIRLRSEYLLKTHKKEIKIKFIDAVLISLLLTLNRYFHIAST